MKKIERRAFICLALALLLAAGLGFFLVKYFLDGGSWASSAFNRHLYNSSGQLASGTVLYRDGDVLSEVVDGQRTYYDNATVRKAIMPEANLGCRGQSPAQSVCPSTGASASCTAPASKGHKIGRAHV